MLADYGVEFVEQPLHPAEPGRWYRFLHARSALPVIVDESCTDSADISLDVVGLADGINIKLAKCGGPREGLRMIHAARSCGLRVMMGCMLESSLGIAPAAHLASLLDYADLDGAALLASDPFVGPGLDGAAIRVGEAPGLGVVQGVKSVSVLPFLGALAGNSLPARQRTQTVRGTLLEEGTDREPDSRRVRDPPGFHRAGTWPPP